MLKRKYCSFLNYKYKIQTLQNPTEKTGDSIAAKKGTKHDEYNSIFLLLFIAPVSFSGIPWLLQDA